MSPAGGNFLLLSAGLFFVAEKRLPPMLGSERSPKCELDFTRLLISITVPRLFTSSFEFQKTVWRKGYGQED